MNSSVACERGRAATQSAEHTISQASLIEYLVAQAVSELIIVEFEEGSYRLEVSLTWKSGKSLLMAARGSERIFRSLDTAVRFLKSVGIGATVVRLELKQ